MKVCNKCHDETENFEGIDMCMSCGVVEGETTDLPDNKMQEFNVLDDVFKSFGDIFGGQKN